MAESVVMWVNACGHLVFQAFSLLPATRQSYLWHCCGVSHQRAVWWQYWTSRLAVAFVLAHGLAMVYRHAPALTELVAVTATPSGWGNLWGLCAGVCVCVCA
jgi:hypothetical protein